MGLGAGKAAFGPQQVAIVPFCSDLNPNKDLPVYQEGATPAGGTNFWRNKFRLLQVWLLERKQNNPSLLNMHCCYFPQPARRQGVVPQGSSVCLHPPIPTSLGETFWCFSSPSPATLRKCLWGVFAKGCKCFATQKDPNLWISKWSLRKYLVRPFSRKSWP